MAYVTPTTLSTGCLVTAASWNQNVVNNVIAIATSPMFFDFVNDAVAIGGAGTQQNGQRLTVDAGSGGNMGLILTTSNSSSLLANMPRLNLFNSNGASNVGISLHVGFTDNGSTVRTGATFGAQLLKRAASAVSADLYFAVSSSAGGLAEAMRIKSEGQLLLGTTASNAFNLSGMTIQQGAADDELFSVKSTDVAHGITSLTETDTYGMFKKYVGANGGLSTEGFTEDIVGLHLAGWATNDTTTKATNSVGAMMLEVGKKSGTGVGAQGASANAVVIQSGGTTVFIFRQDGTSYEHVGTAWVNYDEHDDLELLNMTAAHLSRDPIRGPFAQWANTNRQKLQDLDLVTFNEDGGHFVNRSRMQELLVGAVRQMGEKNRVLEERLSQLERLLIGPPKAGAT